MADEAGQREFVRTRVISSLRLESTLLDGLLHGLSQGDATRATDGPDGWSVVQVVCHLRDLEEIYGQRVASMLAGGNPTFPRVDPDGLAAERDYASQDLTEARAALLAFRKTNLATFEGLNDAGWAAEGIHPAYGQQTVELVGYQMVTHDLIHLEQITRCLGRAERFS